MNAPLSSNLRFDIQGLAQAITHAHASDAVRCQFNTQQWEILAAYMQPFSLRSGQILIQQGAVDRTLYFIESGTLSVHFEDEKSRIRMALVGAGSVLGEGAFFSHDPRNATAQASGECMVWCLTPMRFLELTNRQPAIALDLTLAVGAVMARRLYNRPKRIAVT